MGIFRKSKGISPEQTKNNCKIQNQTCPAYNDLLPGNLSYWTKKSEIKLSLPFMVPNTVYQFQMFFLRET